MTKAFRWLWFAATAAVLANGFRIAMYVVPEDVNQGEISRILYYHVPSWSGMGTFFALNLLCSVAYLAFRNSRSALADKADALAVASAEMGVVYCLIGMVTGSLWGRAAWGIWWTWDARLTTTLVLWLIYVAYLLLRRFTGGAQMKTLSAVMAIFGFADVPIVYMSTRWWRTQHPAPVFFGGPNSGLDPSMLPALFWNLAGWLMWGVFVVSLRYSAERRHQRAEQQAAAAALEAA
ncbi:cytochrome c biogenesis protein CcsA [Silvibacterium acidisoli]|uniref:cytochrome c biogenesis protein CcsA n=1 Tax=Acidobacteriaceae bacterium ZG23-2 TaxID=2883246 RepID=UPI00406C4C8C